MSTSIHIPRRLSRQINRLARRAHAFHRFAHHPLCREYEGELVRLGHKGRVCRGCAYAILGALSGLTLGLGAAVPVPGALLLLCCAALFGFASGRRAKWRTRLLPTLLVGVALGSGIRIGAPEALVLVLLSIFLPLAYAIAYRRRGPDRSPCAICPERSLPSPCRGFYAIVQRERAFRRLSSRWLRRAGI